MFSNDSRLRNAISALSAAAAASASHSPTSPTTPLGSGLIPQSEPPTADYMGDEILFVLPSLQQFETWKNSVETTLVVDFVKGDRVSLPAFPVELRPDSTHSTLRVRPLRHSSST
ncbi:hypothetical protein EXIGLDRAFT_835231 [Exidia glandulosa HHB12029]|uniref:Uncharacterized protein n=1 Tax=Exidia glandulosa HHB12029 TaxID=1314781 RepID=A0A165J0N6_EXIGL|nr:hypothetical protein EXIGLDRAFT_835231 [Exidia glandulosa HHB12029]